MDREKLFHNLRGSLTVLKSDLFFIEQSNNQSEHLLSAKSAVDTLNRTLMNYEIIDAYNKNSLEQSASFLVLQDVVEDIIAQSSSDIAFNNNTIPYVMYADRKYLHLVVTELLHNAATFGNNTQLEVNKKNDHFYLAVMSRGKTLTKNQQNAIGQPFYTIDSDKKTGKSGAGLGLTMVKALCEYNGWDLKITSKDNHTTTALIF